MAGERVFKALFKMFKYSEIHVTKAFDVRTANAVEAAAIGK